MTFDANSFTPCQSLLGGMLIGCAAALLILANGRVAGISGILGGLMRPMAGDIYWRVAFLVGLMTAPLMYRQVDVLPNLEVDASSATVLLAGLLVGIGTRFGGGCTSGHGVCGLARGSLRSFVATVAFMGAGFLTVFLTRYFLHS
jgi:uncharacterized membrane protein YedE/YeeE